MPKEEKRERILEAAFQLFLSKGLTETKMIDIAVAAGVGKGTIYEYFTSKDQLFEMLFERKFFNAYRRLEAVLAEESTARDKLLAFVSFDSTLVQEMNISREVINNLLTDYPRDFNTSPAAGCIKKLVEYRFSLLHELICDGVKNGEFSVSNPLMAAVSIMGATAFYMNFNYNFPHDNPLREYHQAELWNDADFVHLLIQGLSRE